MIEGLKVSIVSSGATNFETEHKFLQTRYFLKS